MPDTSLILPSEIIKVTASSEDALRIQSLNPKKIFIKHLLAMGAMGEIEYLVELSESQGGRGIILCGHSGSGKSNICKKIEEKYPRYETEDVSVIPIVRFDCPAKPTAKGIMQALLHIYSPDCYTGTSNLLEARIKHYIRHCSTKLLIIDEIEHLLHPAGGKLLSLEGIHALNFIKNITNDTNANIALVGTERSRHILMTDFEIQRRFRKVIHLPLFQDDATFRKLLRSIEKTLPLRMSSNLQSDEMASLIWQLTSGIISEIMLLITDAAKDAIRDGSEKITMESLKRLQTRIARINKTQQQKLLDEQAYNFEYIN